MLKRILLSSFLGASALAGAEPPSAPATAVQDSVAPNTRMDPGVSRPAPVSGESFMEAVLAHNASVQAMRQAVVAAVRRARGAGRLDDPLLSISAAPRTLGSAGGPGGDIEISQSLPWWGTLDAQKEVARAESEAAMQDFAGLRLRLAALARGAFADWVYVGRALEINAASLSVLAGLREAARVRYCAGQAPLGEVLQADLERALLKQQQLEWERQRAVVLARMNALLDRAPQTAFPEPTGLPEPSGLPAESELAQGALTHPKLGALAAQRQAAEAREMLAEKERFPKLGVSTGYNSMWPDPAMRPMVGLSITVPIDQEKYRASIDAARAEARRSASMLDDEKASLLAELSAAYATARQAVQSIALYRNELVPLSRSALEAARSEYRDGRGDFLSVLAAQKHRLDADLGLARMQSDYYRALAELDRVSGGGVLEPRSSVLLEPAP